jgi:hypothetical protein
MNIFIEKTLILFRIILGVPPNDYISFFGMRGHDILMGTLVSSNFINNAMLIFLTMFR